MELPQSEKRAREFGATRGLTLDEEPLGYGTDGNVWTTNHNTALKVFELEKNYDRERRCYERLAEHKVTQIDGLNVPRLIDFDDQLLVIEIEIVQPPYLLDFGKAYVDAPPPFDQEQLAAYRESLRQHFRREDLKRVDKVCRLLRAFGIEYLDAKPANIRLRTDREEALLPDDGWDDER